MHYIISSIFKWSKTF